MKMNEDIGAALKTAPQPVPQPMRLQVNGEWVRHEVSARTHLGDFVREQCGLTGTHLGCEHGVCGACTVLLDDKPVRSCITFAVACDHKSVRTVEGYGDDPWMIRLRAAFSREHALQCGYCTPGMLATAYDIVRRLPDADEERIRIELSGNLCRCTGYVGIVRAIASVLAELKQQPVVDAPAAPAAPVADAPGLRPNQDAPMASFVVEQSKQLEQRGADAMAPAAAAKVESRKGWSHIEESFVVDFPAQRVWDYMGDVEALASCLPGAEVLEQDGCSVKGKIAVRFGPIAAAFQGAAALERNDAAWTGILRGAGTDSISQSRAKGDVGYRIVAIDDTHTRVEVTLDHMLQGALAQFSRSGLVSDFVSRMITEFGRNLGARLGNADAPLPAARISVSGTLLDIIRTRIKRIFGR